MQSINNAKCQYIKNKDNKNIPGLKTHLCLEPCPSHLLRSPSPLLPGIVRVGAGIISWVGASIVAVHGGAIDGFLISNNR
jgi:hypothetical protein